MWEDFEAASDLPLLLPCETYAPTGCVTSMVSSGVKAPCLENTIWKRMVGVSKDRNSQGICLRPTEKKRNIEHLL